MAGSERGSGGARPSAVIGQRAAIAGATKVVSHAVLAGLTDAAPRRRALPLALLALDAPYLRWLGGELTGRRMVARAVVESLEAAALTWACADSVLTTRPITIATTVPAAIEYGYRAAVPEAAGPGAGVGRAARGSVGALAAAAPIGAAWLASRWSGRPARPGQVVWTGMGFAAGAAVGLIRGRARRLAGELWSERVRGQRSAEEAMARARVVLPSSPGHNIPSVLHQLREAGSARASERLAELQARKIDVASDPAGATLFSASYGLRVVPDRYGFLWLTNRQIRHLKAFIARADDDPIDLARDVLEVRLIRPSERRNVVTLIAAEVEVSYFGHTTTIPATARWVRGQRLDVIVDGAPAGFLGAACWKLGTLAPSTMRSLPARLVIPAALADCAGVLLHWQLAGEAARHDAVVVGWAIAVAAAFSVGATRYQCRFAMPDGSPLYPATAGSLGAAIILGNYWPRLGWWRHPAALVVLGLPVLGAHPSMRVLRPLAWEVAFTLMAFGSALGLQARADEERATVVESELDRYLSDLHDAATGAAQRELDLYAGCIADARREVGRYRSALGERAEGLLVTTKQAEQWVRTERRLLLKGET